MRNPYSSIQASRQRRQQALHPDHPAVVPLDVDTPLKSVEAEKRAAFRRKFSERLDPEPSAPKLQPRAGHFAVPYPETTPGREPPEEAPEFEAREPPETTLRESTVSNRKTGHQIPPSTLEKRSGFLPIAMPRPDPPDEDAELEYRPDFGAPANIQVPGPSSINDDARTEVSDLSYMSEFTGLNTLGTATQYRATHGYENPLLPNKADRTHFKTFRASVPNDRKLTSVVEARSPTQNHPRGKTKPLESVPNWGDVLLKVEQSVNSTSTSPKCDDPPTLTENSAQPTAIPQQDSPRKRALRLSSPRNSRWGLSLESTVSPNEGREAPPGHEETDYNMPDEESFERRESGAQTRLDPATNNDSPGELLVQGPPTPRDWRKDELFSMLKETLSADGTVTIDTTGCTDIDDEDLSTVFAGLQDKIPNTQGVLSQDSLARSRDSTTFFSSLGPGGSPKGHGRPAGLAGLSQRQAPQNEEQKPPETQLPSQQTVNDDGSMFGQPFLKGETRDDNEEGRPKGPCYSFSSSIKYLKTVAEDIGTQLQNIQNIVADKDMDGMLEVLNEELKKAKESTPEKTDEFVRFLGEEFEKTGCGIDRTKGDNDWTVQSKDLIKKAKNAFARAKEHARSTVSPRSETQETAHKKPIESFQVMMPPR